MRLVLATPEFTVEEVPAPGFPLLVNSDGRVVEPALLFLVHHLLHRGAVHSERSWETYGFVFLDFFSFLESNNRAWDDPHLPGTASVVAQFRKTALKRGAKRSTVNGRLHLICLFYRHAHKQGWIKRLPFDLEARALQEQRTDSRRVSPPRRTSSREVPDVMLRVPRTNPRVLSGPQIAALLDGLENQTHRLIALLQLSTGIRVEEAATFPVKYVVDPRLHPGVKHYFSITLNPNEMSTKGSVSRVIHIPRSLMAELWAYVAVNRNERVRMSSPDILFLTQEGKKFTRNSIWYLFARVADAAGFHVSPHILRHTYATHTLAALRPVMNLGNALLYLKARLGHASIRTTEKYCQLVDDIVDSVLNTYQQELLQAAKDEP